MAKRIVFLGTPSYACPALEHLASRGDCEVILVVTQPDRPAGRGRKLQAPAVKTLALDLGLPIVQTGSLRTIEARLPLVTAQPDLIVVAAFGLILGKSVLSLPPNGCVNLHASLLPAYRGANPIAAAIASGERLTGVSLMRMERGLDTGPVYSRDSIYITTKDTTESLTGRLAERGADLLDRSLPALLDGTAHAQAQGTGAKCTRPMVKDDGWIDWTLPAVEIERHVRAMWPWPRAWTTLPDNSRVQIHAAEVIAGQHEVAPGTIAPSASDMLIQCGEDTLRLVTVQVAGGKPGDGTVLRTRVPAGSDSLLGQTGGPPDLMPLLVGCPGE